MSQIAMSQDTHMNKSCDTPPPRVVTYIPLLQFATMSQIAMSQDTHMNESCDTPPRVATHIPFLQFVTHVTNCNESRHTYESTHIPFLQLVTMSQTAMSQDTHMTHVTNG